MPRIPKSKIIIEESENVGGELQRSNTIKTTIRKTKNIAKRYTPKADTIKKVGRVAKVVAPIVVNPLTGIAIASTQLKKRQIGLLPPSVRNLLKEIGNEKIISIKIVRTPIENAIKGLLNIISLGSYNKAVKDANYDSMFHLALFINDSITLDKQAVISMVKSNPVKDNSEIFTVAIGNDQNITYQQLLDNTREFMGDNLFSNYDSRRNNCQDFVMAILKSNDLNSPQAQTFVKQDAESVFQKMPAFTDKVAGFFTNIGAVADQLLEGEGSLKQTPDEAYFEEWIQIGKNHYFFPIRRGGEVETTQPQGLDVDLKEQAQEKYLKFKAENPDFEIQAKDSQKKYMDKIRDDKIKNLYGDQVLKAINKIEHKPISDENENLPERFHVGEYYAQRDPNKTFYTVHHQITSRIVGQQLSYRAAKNLMKKLDKETLEIQEEDMEEIINKENKIKKKLIQKPKKEKKSIKKPINKKKTMESWREFWSKSCKGKKFGSRAEVNNYMKEMAKKYKEMKAKSK